MPNRRITYVLKENDDTKNYLKLPQVDNRLNRSFPLFEYVDKAKKLNVVKAVDDHPRHSLGVTSLALDLSTQLSGENEPKGILYSSGKDGLVASWQLSSKNQIQPKFRQSIQTHTDHCNDLVLCSGNQILVSASSDRTVKAWKPHKEDGFPTLIGTHGDYVKNLSYGKESNKISSSGLDKQIKLWDLHENRYNPILSLSESHSIYSLCMNSSASFLVSGTPSNNINLWDLKSCKNVNQFEGHSDNVRSLLLSHDGMKALSSSSDSTIKLWDLRMMKCLKTYDHHNDSVWTLHSQDGNLDKFYSGDRSGKICKVNENNDSVINLANSKHGVARLISVENDYIFSASPSSSTIHIWKDVNDDAKFNNFKNNDIQESNNDDDRVSVNSRISNDVVNDEPIQIIKGRHGIIRALMMNNRRHVLTLNTHRHVSLWDIVLGVCIGQYTDECIDNMIDDKEELTSQEILEVVKSYIDGEGMANAWSSIDCQTGSLAINIDETRCFDGEAYLDELGLDNVQIDDENKDKRINLSKLIMSNLFKNFIQYQKDNYSNNNEDEGEDGGDENDKNSHYVNSNASGGYGTPTPGTPQIRISRQMGTPPNTPGLPPPALPAPPLTQQQQSSSTTSLPNKTNSESNNDYFSLEHHNNDSRNKDESVDDELHSSPNLQPNTNNHTLSSSPSSSRLSGFMGRMLLSNSRSNKEKKQQLSRSTSQSQLQTQINEESTIKSVRRRFKPPSENECPNLNLDANIPVVISEEGVDSEAYVSIYRGLIGTTGERNDSKVIERVLPSWGLEMILANNMLRDARNPKCTFWLERHPNENKLGELPEV